MQNIIALLEYFIQTAGALGVFGSSIFEEVFSIIPSSVVQTGAGVFIMTGLSVTWTSIFKLIFVIAIPAALGVTLGSLVYVWLARKIGILAIEKYGKWIGVSMQHIRKLEQRLEKTKWDDIVFVLLRAFPAVPSVALAVYAGIIEMTWKKYIILTFIGVFIRATILAFIGWMFRDSLSYWNDLISLIGFEVGIVCGIVFIIYLIFSYYNKKIKHTPHP